MAELCLRTGRKRLALVAALVLTLGALSQSASAQTADEPETTPSQRPTPTITLDPNKLVQDAFAALLGSFTDGMRDGVDSLWAANFITQTPRQLTYANEHVRSLYGVMQGAANAALLVVASLAGLNVIARAHFGPRYHSLGELAPRLILGAILINTALWWCQFAIDLNNALAATIGSATPPNWNTLNGAHQTLVDVVLGLVYVIFGLLLVIQMLLRLVWIDVLLVAAPAAAACWVLPQTQGWAQTWNQQFTGAVFTQFVQVIALKLGASLVVAVGELQPNVTWLAFVVGVATLWLTWRIPGLMRAGAGGNIADGLARIVAMRVLLRGAGGR